MFDERFARQYRYEPPSEFPLTSPYTGIVHHLSGPKNNALTQTFLHRIMVGRCCASLAPFTFISRAGFSTTTLALVLDSLVRVSRRVGKNHFDKIAQSPSSRPTTQPGTDDGEPPPAPLLAPADSILSHARQEVTRGRRLPTYRGEEFISTASASTISSLLTFFPKCFSSFLHSTCSLSVSYIYLALEEVYLPLCAPVSRYTTLWAPA